MARVLLADSQPLFNEALEALFSRDGAAGVVGKTCRARLSPRERSVLALLSRGWDNARIGRELFISQHTVRSHIQNILEKLGMHSKLEAATFAMQRSAELELTPGGAGLGT